jgi:hypothetical protein
MRIAYTAVIRPEGGYGIGRADAGTKGYTPCPDLGSYATWDEARTMAATLNTDMLHLDKIEALKIVAGTMR